MSKKQRYGWLTDYYSQGSEGQIEWAFMDASSADAKGWDESGIVQLEQGDILTLFNPDKTILWKGAIEKIQGNSYGVFDNKGELVLLNLIFHDRERLPFSSWIPQGIAVQRLYRKVIAALTFAPSRLSLQFG